MRRGKRQGHEQPDPPPTGTPSTLVHVAWHDTPPTPAQLAAWNALWARLLGQGARDDTPRAHDHSTPGEMCGINSMREDE